MVIGEVNAWARNGPVERNSDVGKTEERQDQVTGPRVIVGLQAGVERQRGGQAGARRLGLLRGGIVAEPAEQAGRLLEVRASGRVRRRQSHSESGDDRIDAAGHQRRPHRQPECVEHRPAHEKT